MLDFLPLKANHFEKILKYCNIAVAAAAYPDSDCDLGIPDFFCIFVRSLQ